MNRTTNTSQLAAGHGQASRSRIRRHSTHVLDGWTLEIFLEPSRDCFLARVVGLPGLVGRGPTEAASVSQLRRLLNVA
jgi:hypothetical protein